MTLVPPLGATSIRLASLEEMVQFADRVFRGRCLATRVVPGVVGMEAMEYTFEVSEGVKGTETGQRIVFRQVLAPRRGMRGIAGMPSYHEGQDLLMFLHGDSQLGLTSAESSLLSQGGSLPLRTLTSAIRKIDRYQTANQRAAQ